jgi:hypothetical protein
MPQQLGRETAAVQCRPHEELPEMSEQGIVDVSSGGVRRQRGDVCDDRTLALGDQAPDVAARQASGHLGDVRRRARPPRRGERAEAREPLVGERGDPWRVGGCRAAQEGVRIR